MILRHERWREAMEVHSAEFVRPTKYLIEEMPKAAITLLNNCVKTNGKSPNDHHYAVSTLKANQGDRDLGLRLLGSSLTC